MRIGIDAKRIFFNETGLGNYSRSLVNSLLKYHPDVELVLYTPKEITDLENSGIEQLDRVQLRSPKGWAERSFGGSIWRSASLGKILAKDKLDIYHGLSNELPSNIRKAGIPSVVTIHDLIFLRHPDYFPAIDRRIYKKKFRSACEKADKIIAVSEQTKDDIVEFFKIAPEKIEVVYQSCNPIFYESAQMEVKNFLVNNYNLHERFILNVSSMTERKNQINLLKAFKIVREHIPELNLVIIGTDGDYKEKIKTFIKSQNLYGSVQIIENCSLIRMPAFYQIASLFVYPSVYEGFGIPILESLFSKTPVIASDNKCFREAANGGASYVNTLSPQDLAFKIIELLNDDVKRSQMVKDGFKHIQDMKDVNFANNTMKVYQSLMA